MNPKEFELIQNLRLGIQSANENFGLHIELFKLTAKAKRSFFESCVEEGFSKEEALELAAAFNPYGV